MSTAQSASSDPAPLLISACLTGQSCRYNGAHQLDSRLLSRLAPGSWVPFCPEQAGGLPTPRPRAELQSGDGHAVLAGKAFVVNENGVDVSAQFLAGAYATLAVAREQHATTAYLKQFSPSCGCGFIRQQGQTIAGDGVTAALLKQAGLTVIAVE